MSGITIKEINSEPLQNSISDRGGRGLTKRIIPCLDIKDGRTVKGINFESIRDAGDPVELAILYSENGADELVFLDITATIEKRKTLVELVKRIAANINIPLPLAEGSVLWKMLLYCYKMERIKFRLILLLLKILPCYNN